MNLKQKILLLIFIPFVFVFQDVAGQTFAPDVIASSGTFAASASGSMTWTIGEVMTETYSANGNIFTQGFNQPNSGFVTAISNPVSQNISIYPNPVADNLFVDFSSVSGNYSIELFDMHGQLLRKKIIPLNQNEIKITFNEFANGFYLLNIVNTETNIRSSYRISKTE